MGDSFSDPRDKQEIHELRMQVEFMRDFIIWLCEEELETSIPEMEERFKEYEKMNEADNPSNQK